jgi:hypothetical protein
MTADEPGAQGAGHFKRPAPAPARRRRRDQERSNGAILRAGFLQASLSRMR